MASVVVGAYGQPTPAAAAGAHDHGLPHHHVGRHSGRQRSAQARAWRIWCRHHSGCLANHSWVATKGNARVRAQAWRRWCLKHQSCIEAHPAVRRRYVLAGPTGEEISRLPEGEYLSTFMHAARGYGVSVRILMAIGIVESGGGVAGTAYMGCMDYSTFGSWPGQIYCAAQVLSLSLINI